MIMNEQDLNEFIIEFVYNSEAIEGCPIDHDSCKSYIMNGYVKSPLEPDIYNWIKQMKIHYYMLNELLNRKPYLHIADIKRYHEMLLRDRLQDAGMFRIGEAYITNSDAVLAKSQYIYPLICDFLDSYNNFIFDFDKPKTNTSRYTKPIYKGCGIRHARFEKIHPFSDGNGRIGRAILLHDMNRHGLPLKMIKVKYVSDYYDALAGGEDTFGEYFANLK